MGTVFLVVEKEGNHNVLAAFSSGEVARKWTQYDGNSNKTSITALEVNKELSRMLERRQYEVRRAQEDLAKVQELMSQVEQAAE